MNKYFHILGAALAVTFLLGTISQADVVVFKNGFRTEGTVTRTDEGIWVNGGLFQEEDIKKIIKDPPPVPEQPQPVTKEKEKPVNWWDLLFGKKEETKEKIMEKIFEKEETPQTTRKPKTTSVTYTDNLPGSQPQHQRQKPATHYPQPTTQYPQPTTGGGLTSFADAMTRAQQMQQEAEMRQNMMMQEMMRAEYGYYDEIYGAEAYGADPYDYEQEYNKSKNKSSSSSYKKSYNKSRSSSSNKKNYYSYGQDKSNSSSGSSYGDSNSKNKNVSPFSQGIKINKDGSMDWE